MHKMIPTLRSGVPGHLDFAAAARRRSIDAFEAYRQTLPPGERSLVDGPDRVVAGRSDAPANALAATVADLASALFAGVHVVEAGGGDPSDARTALRVEAVDATLRATDAAMAALAGRDRPDAVATRVEVAHRAGYAAHLAADLLTDAPARSDAAGHHQPRPASLPDSRRTLLARLGEGVVAARRALSRQPLDERQRSQQLVDAAAAARDGAAHVVASYDACTSAEPACRLARISMRAACHAGFAALEVLRQAEVAGPPLLETR